MAGEFDRIKRYFAPLTQGFPGAFALTDDAAAITPLPGEQIIVTTDALIAGVHFIGDEPPGLIAQKALRVNLSDLAAMGAKPLAYTLALMLPAEINDAWLSAFSDGLRQDQHRFGIHLIGGDSIATPGPPGISITAFGSMHPNRLIRRSGATPGDIVCVTGTFGDAALGLLLLRDELDLPAAEAAMLIERYHLPTPRNQFALALDGRAHSGIDISDGLLADLGHIAEVSGVAIVIEAAKVPLSAAAKNLLAQNPALIEKILTGGDDYELALTISPSDRATVCKLAAAENLPVTVIGKVEVGKGVTVLNENGERLNFSRFGYQHF